MSHCVKKSVGDRQSNGQVKLVSNIPAFQPATKCAFVCEASSPTVASLLLLKVPYWWRFNIPLADSVSGRQSIIS